MLSTIANLPDRYNIFMHKSYVIYVLNGYSISVMLEVKARLLRKGYIFVGIGGEVAGYIHIDDTVKHGALKVKYQQLEQKLIIDQLSY